MDVMGMTVDEILILNGLVPIAREAKEAAEAIQQAYSHGFGIGQDKIEVWRDRDANNFEYLTHGGVWEARYLHQTYDVVCSADSIFEYLRAEYLINNGFAKEYTEDFCRTPEGEYMEVVRYLRSFIARTKDLVEKKE